MYVAMDAVDTLSIIMVNDVPESARFLKVIGGLIEEVAKTARNADPRVAFFAESVSLLWQEGKADAAIRLERLWNQLTATHDVDILCGYKIGSAHSVEDDHDFKRICAEHSAVYSQ